MITTKQWMELANFRITEGSDYGWSCFGYDAYSLDAWNGDNENGWTLCITFGTKTHEVYQVEVHDYKNERAYRYTNPDHRDAFQKETKARKAVHYDEFEGYSITDLEVEDDWIEKATAIVAGEEYDTRVTIPIDFTDEELLQYMTMAHELDMTFNAFIEMALRNMIDRMKANGELDETFS
jgi:hypothetical protein